MSAARITIDQYLYEVLKERAHQAFTVVQVRDSYLTKLPTPISPDDARKAIYRQLLRLVKSGALTKHPNSNPQRSTYRVMNNFNQMSFKCTMPSHQRAHSNRRPTQTSGSTPPSRFEEQLRQFYSRALQSQKSTNDFIR
jgi:hypothetical protein